MIMLIILEGCDGVGKTTLANYLARIMDAEIIHCTKETPNDLKFFNRIIAKSIFKNIIADRFCYGQFVYQTRQERNLTKDDLRILEESMLLVGAKLIHVVAPVREIEKRLALRGEKLDMSIWDILWNYHRIIEQSILPVVQWGTGEGGFHE